MQYDFGATLFTSNWLDGELAVALGFPVHALFNRCAGSTGEYVDFVGHDKGGVETHSKLTNQFAVFLFITGQLLEELGGARPGNGTQVGDHVVTCHPDAIVGQGDGAGVFVVIEADFEFGVAFKQAVVFQGGEAQFVFGV